MSVNRNDGEGSWPMTMIEDIPVSRRDKDSIACLCTETQLERIKQDVYSV